MIDVTSKTYEFAWLRHEYVEILKCLVGQTTPMSVRDVARAVCCPEISTRNRLEKMESHGALRSARRDAILAPGKSVCCIQYVLTQYGKDCLERKVSGWTTVDRIPAANSVFSWAASVNAAS